MHTLENLHIYIKLHKVDKKNPAYNVTPVGLVEGVSVDLLINLLKN